MRITYLIICLLCVTDQVFAQYNTATMYSNHGDLNIARYFPSKMDIHGNKKVQIGANYYLYAGNTALNYEDLKRINDRKVLESADIDRFIRSLKKENLFGVGQDYQVLGLGFQFSTKKGKNFDFSFTAVDKFGASFTYSDNFLKLAWRGNKQFAGVKTDLGPLRMDVSYTREFCFGSAFPLIGSENKIGLRGGFRVKYIQGIASVYVKKSQASIFTDTSGRLVTLDLDYNVRAAGLKKFSPLAFSGNGLGIDLGGTVYLGKNLEIAASVLDIGEVKYTKDARVFAKKGTFAYEGLIVGNLLGDPRIEESRDSIQYIFKPQRTGDNSYVMPLSTRFIIQAEIKDPRDNGKHGERIANAVYITYAQGLTNLPGTTTRPFVSVGYNHDFHDIFAIGAAASYGGFNGLALGSFFSLKIAHTLKLGLGSDNLTAFFYKKLGTGIDFSSNFSLSF